MAVFFMSLRANQKCQVMRALATVCHFSVPHISNFVVCLYPWKTGQAEITMSGWDICSDSRNIFQPSETSHQVLVSVPVILHQLSMATQSKLHNKRDRDETFFPKEAYNNQNVFWGMKPDFHFLLISLAVIMILLNKRHTWHLQILGATSSDMLSGSCWKSFWEM